MQHVPAHDTEVWADDQCDMCGKTRDDVEGEDRALADWFTGELNVYRPDAETSEALPLNGLEIHIDAQFDICGPCFRQRLLPFMQASKQIGDARD